jgi:hypothetical protein
MFDSQVDVLLIGIWLVLTMLYTIEYFLTVYWNISRSVDPDAHLVTLDTQNSHGDVIAYHKRFAHSPGQDQHTSIGSIEMFAVWPCRIVVLTVKHSPYYT